jgi:hypothetical protein
MFKEGSSKAQQIWTIKNLVQVWLKMHEKKMKHLERKKVKTHHKKIQDIIMCGES